jgi:hypothetical protein
MLEQAGRFLVREKYLDPRYKNQLEEWEKKRQGEAEKKVTNLRRFQALKARAGLAKEEMEKFEEGIKHGEKIFFPLLFACALATDFADLLPVFIDKIIKIAALAVIWYNILVKGSSPGYLDPKYRVEISFRVRLIMRLLGLVDLLPFIDILPLTTFSVFIVWLRVRQQVRERKKALGEQGQEGTVVANAGKPIIEESEQNEQFEPAEQLKLAA